MFLASFLLSLAQASTATPPVSTPAAPVSSPRRARRLFFSPMGEPFRAKARDDDTLADWFAQADANRDGRITMDEMQGDAARFFALLDVNKDGEIDPDEITRYENEIAPEVRSGEHFTLALEGANTEGDRGGRRDAAVPSRDCSAVRKMLTRVRAATGCSTCLSLLCPPTLTSTAVSLSLSSGARRSSDSSRSTSITTAISHLRSSSASGRLLPLHRTRQTSHGRPTRARCRSCRPSAPSSSLLQAESAR